MNVACVVVTFNRKDLLIDCLKALLEQTCKINKIYLIDNNSSDGTYEALQDEGLLKNPAIEYHNTKANLGGAGGFSFGMEKATQSKHEWYWLMDDDVEPYKDSLEQLLQYKDQSKCIHPQKIFSDGSSYSWDGHFDPRIIRTTWIRPERLNDLTHAVEVNYGCFEGMLIHHDIVEKIGIPDKRFFIHTDDLLYGYLASLHTKVLYTNTSKFLKKIKKDHSTNFLGANIPYLNGFNQYFNLRNHMLLREYLLREKVTKPALSYVWFILKFIKLFLMSSIVHRNKKDTQMIVWGFMDGIKKRYDGHKRFISN